MGGAGIRVTEIPAAKHSVALRLVKMPRKMNIGWYLYAASVGCFAIAMTIKFGITEGLMVIAVGLLFAAFVKAVNSIVPFQ